MALTRDEQLMPPRPDSMGRGLAMAIVAHVLLVVALTLSVNWRSSEPAGIEAELWASVPQIAAPPAVAPEPPKPVAPPKPEPRVETPPKPAQPDPQIAIEQEKKKKELLKREQEEKAEKEKAEKLKTDKAEADKKKKEEAQQLARVEAQRQAQLKRVLEQAGAGNTPGGTAAQTAGPSANYAGRVKAKVKPNITFTESVAGNPTAEVEVNCAPDGTILKATLLKSSGIAAWDNAVLRALEKTEMLPRDTDGRVPSPMILTFRPNDL